MNDSRSAETWMQICISMPRDGCKRNHNITRIWRENLTFSNVTILTKSTHTLVLKYFLKIVHEVPLSFGRLTKIKWKIFIDNSLKVLSGFCLCQSWIPSYECKGRDQRDQQLYRCFTFDSHFFFEMVVLKVIQKYETIKNNIKSD